jgi:hypothetical protein
MFVLFFHTVLLYIVGQLSKLTDIVLLLKITQILLITICVVLDDNTVIFQKEKGEGGTYKITGVQDSNSQGRQNKKKTE